MAVLLTILQVEPNPETNQIWYRTLKNDFTDDEFEDICVKMAKKENAYGKYPKMHLFYQNKPSKKEIEDSTMTNVFNTNFNTLSTELLKNFSTFTGEGLHPHFKRCLDASGGFAELWRLVHDLDMPKSIANIRKDFERNFFDGYKADQVVKALESQANMAKIGDLTKGIG